MYKHILVPIDGSKTADKAVEAGIDFAREARAILDPAAERLRAADVECDTAYSECDRPFQAIVAAALWYGSETRDVIAHSPIPTLVYH
jgi:nucleotide-binding universal stress UspA family protein